MTGTDDKRYAAYDNELNIQRRLEGKGNIYRFVRPRTVIYAGIIVLVSAWLSSSWYILDLVQRLLFGNRRSDLRYADLLQTELAALVIVVLTLLALGIVPISLFGPDRTATSTGAEPPGAHSGSLAWNR